jgi:hypothetical protein
MTQLTLGFAIVIPGYRMSWRDGDRIIVVSVPAHTVTLT